MAALPNPPDPFDPPDGNPQSTDVPLFEVPTCDRVKWCYLDAGHPGNHRKDPATKVGHHKAKPSQSPAPRGSRSAGKRGAGSSPMPGLLAMAYGVAGMRIEASGPPDFGPPVGRVMQFQAFDAGQALHRILLALIPGYEKATKFTGGGGGISADIVAIVGAPLLAGLMATNDTAKHLLWPIFAEQIKASAVTIAKAQREQIDTMNTVGEYQAEVDDMMAHLEATLFEPRPDYEPEETTADA